MNFYELTVKFKRVMISKPLMKGDSMPAVGVDIYPRICTHVGAQQAQCWDFPHGCQSQEKASEIHGTGQL